MIPFILIGAGAYLLYDSQKPEKMAYGGVVTFVKEEDKYKKSWGRKAKHDDMDCIGAFDIKGWKGDYGYLYMLNDFDKKFYSHIPLKANEMLFRYRSDAADIGMYTPVIKINLARGLIYFLEDLYADDDKNLVFEARGVKPLFISVHDKVYEEMTKQRNYKMTEKFEDGGAVGDIVMINEDKADKANFYHWFGKELEIIEVVGNLFRTKVKETIEHLPYLLSKEEIKVASMASGGEVNEGWEKQPFWHGNRELGLDSYRKYFKNPFNGKKVPVYVFGKSGLYPKPFTDWNYIVSAGANSDYSYSGGFPEEIGNSTPEKCMEYVDSLYEKKKLIYADGGKIQSHSDQIIDMMNGWREKTLKRLHSQLAKAQFDGATDKIEELLAKIKKINPFSDESDEVFAHGGDVAIDEKYAKEFDDEDRGWWSDRYKEINGFRPTMSNTELIKWANENFTLKVTKSSDGSKVHKELIYKDADKLADGGIISTENARAFNASLKNAFKKEGMNVKVEIINSYKFPNCGVRVYPEKDFSNEFRLRVFDSCGYDRKSLLHPEDVSYGVIQKKWIAIQVQQWIEVFNKKLAKGGKLPPLPILNEAYKYAKNRGVEYNGSFEEFKISFKKKTPKSAKYSEQVLKAVYYSLQQPEFGKGGIVDNVKKVIADKKAWKTYKRWESINNHSENAVLLAYAVGTKKDQEETVEIMEKHHKSEDGISPDLYQRRNEISRRLYPMFKIWYAKNEEGLKMADGGSVSSKKDPEIAKTILRQLGGSGRLTAMTGAYGFADLGNGLSFRMKNPRANFVKITLNSRDLYNVEVGRIRGAAYKIIKEQNDLFFDQMKPFIEKATGLYLSLKDGGLVENPVFTFKTKAEYEAAEMRGYIDEYDIVRVVIKSEGSEVDFPVNSEEEYKEVLKTHGESVISSYQNKTYYDIQDYAEDEDFGTDPEDEYKKGGKIKKRVRFVDKVSAIAEKLKGTAVPKRLQYDYGKRYDKKEAEQAGRRIAGSMLKKEKIK